MFIGSIKNNKKFKYDFDSSLIENKFFYILNNLVKLSLLSILSGYKKCDYIYVNDYFENIELKQLNSFISYTLNHNIAPKKFKIRISQNKELINKEKNKEKNDYDCVLCFSGGIDSTAGFLYALDRGYKVAPLWIDFGQRNNKTEFRSLNKILKKLKIKPIVIKVNLKKFILDGWKDWNFIVPGRNFLFLTIANSILQNSNKSKGTIYLCAHKDEMGYKKNRDKSKHFFDTCSQLFTTSGNKEIKVLTPFEKYSKSEILSYWRRNWESAYGISPYETTTCYYENNCGECEACLKRAIYLSAAGYKSDPSTKINPMKDEKKYMKNIWLPKIQNGIISHTNKYDFLIAVENNIDIVSRDVKRFFLDLSSRTKASLAERKREINQIKI